MYTRILLTLFGLVQIYHFIQLTTATDSHDNPSSIYEPCNNQISVCFGFPDNCVAQANCQMLFRSQYDEKSVFHMQIISPSITHDKYISVGFSNNSIMSGLVVQCFYSSEQKKSVLEYSFNTYNKRHNAQIKNQTDVTGFSSEVVSYQDGQMLCQWKVEQPAKVHYQENIYDFEQDKFYIQLALGPYDPKKNKIHYHSSNRGGSNSAMSLKGNSTVPPKGSAMTVRWHVSLMIFGWIACMSFAIFMS